MIARKEFIFPLWEVDGIKAVETAYLDLARRYREGEKLEDEDLDYMDYANNILMIIE